MSEDGETSYDWQWDDDDMIPGPYNRDEDDATDETPGDLDFDEVYDDHPWQWTPRTMSFDPDTSDSSMPELQRPDGSVHVPLWLCRNCHSTQWRTHGEGYVCLDCGCPNFYDANLPHSHDTGLGSWTYTPHAPRGETRHDDPRPVGHEARETAESEVPTDDPSVDPSTLQPVTRPSRRQRKARKQAAGRDSDSHVPQQPAHTPLRAPVLPGLSPKVPRDDPPPSREQAAQTMPMTGESKAGKGADAGKSKAGKDVDAGKSKAGKGKGDGTLEAGSDHGSSKNAGWRDEMLKSMHGIHNKSQQEKPWDITKGPGPGLKYRGGSPPLPPAWDAQKGDLQAFQRWERKLALWRRQIRSYLPPNEASMYLFVNLGGEAAEELEHCDLDKVDDPQGIEYVLETLRAPLMVKGIYLKRKLLDDFERLSRRVNESIRSFTNRYHRCERSLAAVGVHVNHMYDEEAAGSRLLDRMRLSAEAQRMILVATSNSIRYQDVKEAAETQFPEHRAVPAVVYTRDFETHTKEPRERTDQPVRDQGKSKGKGKHKGKSSSKSSSSNTFVRSSYLTEVPEGDQADEEQGAMEETHEDEGEQPPDELEAEPHDLDGEDEAEADADMSDLDLAAHCLTVTARRLSGMRLGRKFSGGGKSIAQRKAESHCAVCGQKGHWQGDKECPQSGTPSGDGKPKTGKDDSKTKGSGKKVLLTVAHPDGCNRSVTFNTDTNDKMESPMAPTLPMWSLHHQRCLHRDPWDRDCARFLVLTSPCSTTT